MGDCSSDLRAPPVRKGEVSVCDPGNSSPVDLHFEVRNGHRPPEEAKVCVFGGGVVPCSTERKGSTEAAGGALHQAGPDVENKPQYLKWVQQKQGTWGGGGWEPAQMVLV